PQVVDQHEQDHSSQPRHGCFPTKPADLARTYVERLLLLDRVEATAVNHPHGRELFVRRSVVLKSAELSIEPCKVIRLPDPHNAGKDVEPTDTQVQPLSNR